MGVYNYTDRSRLVPDKIAVNNGSDALARAWTDGAVASRLRKKRDGRTFVEPNQQRVPAEPLPKPGKRSANVLIFFLRGSLSGFWV